MNSNSQLTNHSITQWLWFQKLLKYVPLLYWMLNMCLKIDRWATFEWEILSSIQTCFLKASEPGHHLDLALALCLPVLRREVFGERRESWSLKNSEVLKTLCSKSSREMGGCRSCHSGSSGQWVSMKCSGSVRKKKSSCLQGKRRGHRGGYKNTFSIWEGSFPHPNRAAPASVREDWALTEHFTPMLTSHSRNVLPNLWPCWLCFFWELQLCWGPEQSPSALVFLPFSFLSWILGVWRGSLSQQVKYKVWLPTKKWSSTLSSLPTLGGILQHFFPA